MTSPIIITLFPTPLAESVARLLHTNLLTAKFERFADSEIKVTLPDPELFHDAQVHIFQSTGMPVNDTVLGVAFLAQQLKQAGARKVILVCPYFGYSRQEKPGYVYSADAKAMADRPGHLNSVRPDLLRDLSVQSGPAGIIAKLYEASGIDELITVELHDPLLKSFFTIPIHELSLTDAIAAHIKRFYGGRTDLCIVAPDKGAHDKAAQIALLVGAGVLVFSKERYAADQTRVVGVSGNGMGKTAILIDDILDTGGTAINVATALLEMHNTSLNSSGRTVGSFIQVVGYFVHPVFSGDALDRIDKSPFSHVFVSNTLPLKGESRKVETFDISGMLAELIYRFRS